MGCADDYIDVRYKEEIYLDTLLTNVSDCGSNADFDTRITFLCQLALEEFVQLSIEDTVGNKLPPLRDSSSLCGSCHDCGYTGEDTKFLLKLFCHLVVGVVQLLKVMMFEPEFSGA